MKQTKQSVNAAILLVEGDLRDEITHPSMSRDPSMTDFFADVLDIPDALHAISSPAQAPIIAWTRHAFGRQWAEDYVAQSLLGTEGMHDFNRQTTYALADMKNAPSPQAIHQLTDRTIRQLWPDSTLDTHARRYGWQTCNPSAVTTMLIEAILTDSGHPTPAFGSLWDDGSETSLAQNQIKLALKHGSRSAGQSTAHLLDLARRAGQCDLGPGSSGATLVSLIQASQALIAAMEAKPAFRAQYSHAVQEAKQLLAPDARPTGADMLGAVGQAVIGNFPFEDRQRIFAYAPKPCAGKDLHQALLDRLMPVTASIMAPAAITITPVPRGQQTTGKHHRLVH